MYKTILFTTQELFEKVWETPVLKLAQEIGVSDVGLAKACRKAGIPMPARGYWAKQPNRRPAKPEPPVDAGPISFQVLDRALLPPKPKIPETPKTFVNRVEVPEAPVNPHPLIAKWLKCAQSAKVYEGRFQTADKQVLQTRISPSQIDRSALLLDTLIKASETAGHRWAVTADKKTTIEVEKEKFTLELKERITKSPLPPAPPSTRKRGAPWEPNFSLLDRAQYEWVSTGELSLHIDADSGYGTRKTWADTKTKKVEDRLDTILEGFLATAASIKALRAKRAEERRLSAIQEAKRLERARHDETHRRLRRELVKNSERWQRAAQLRAFIKATCNANANSPRHVQEQTALWATWASAQADKLDPLYPNTASVTAMTVEIESWFSGYGLGRTEKDWWSE